MRSHTAALRGAVRGALLALHGLIPQKGPYLPPPLRDYKPEADSG